MTHRGNESVVSMPSKAADLLQKGAHALFSPRTLQLLLTQLLYLPAAENLQLFQQGWCKYIRFLHRLMIQLHNFLFQERYNILLCLTGFKFKFLQHKKNRNWSKTESCTDLMDPGLSRWLFRDA